MTKSTTRRNRAGRKKAKRSAKPCGASKDLPTSLVLDECEYKVIPVHASPMNREDADGLCDNTACEIYYPAHAPHSRQVEIILHEVLHAGLAGHEYQDEEPIIVILGKYLHRVIQNNPQFFQDLAQDS